MAIIIAYLNTEPYQFIQLCKGDYLFLSVSGFFCDE